MAAPSNLSVTGTGTGANCDLTWTNNPALLPYSSIEIQYKGPSVWHTLTDTYSGTATSYNNFSVTNNVTWTFRVRGYDTSLFEWSSWSNEDTFFRGYDEESETITIADTFSATHTQDVTYSEIITISDALSGGNTVADTYSETITISDILTDSQTIKTNRAYYFGSSNGDVFEFSPAYKSDAGVSILCNWKSKVTDFADQYTFMLDTVKTVHNVKLIYVDVEEIDITIYVSNDGGNTFTSKSATIGSGTGKTKSKTFWFIKTGEFFQFIVENGSTDKSFIWIALEVSVESRGEHFDVT